MIRIERISSSPARCYGTAGGVNAWHKRADQLLGLAP